MKKILTLVALLTSSRFFAQSSAQVEALRLSKQIFGWEINNKTDSLAGLLDENFKAINSHGEVQTKQQYLTTLRNGNIKHESTTVEQEAATAANNTAILIGKGRFLVTVAGNKRSLHLSYMEVFTKYKRGWKLVALCASALPE